MDSIRNKAKPAPKEIDQDATIDHEIQQFFEIIRRFREARAAAGHVEGGGDGRAGKKKRKMSGGWVPKFQREDFDSDSGGAADDDKKKTAGIGNGGGGGSDKKSLDDRLDLELTL